MNTKTSRTKLDMTKGPIMKLIVLFAIPMVIGNILQQLYSTADTFIIGNFCGSASIAAVGTSSQPLEVFLCVFMGIGTGVSILTSIHTGAGDDAGLGKLVRTAVSFTYLAALPLMFLGIVLTPAILKLMQVPADTWDLAVTYIRIVFLGLLGNMGYNMNAGILRGLGDSTASLVFLVISTLANIALDTVFVALLHMDVAGAALATVIAMYLSWAASIYYIKKKYPELPFSVLPGLPDRKTLGDIMKNGLPLGFNNSIYTVGHIMLQSLINTQGSYFMAGTSVSGKIMGISSVAIASFAAAMSTFAGQNYGAGNYRRLQRGGRIVPFYSALVTIALGSVMYAAAEPLAGLFTKEPQAVEYALLCLRMQLPFQWCFCVLNTVLNLANGIGGVKYSTVVNLLMLWAVRIPSAFLIARFYDGHYVTFGVSISFMFGMAAALGFYRSKRWKEVTRLAKRQAERSQKMLTNTERIRGRNNGSFGHTCGQALQG
ncbi:MAG: MATE family efflux transporter [Lachnospiraceae bacterium]|nr:MATE family efflux transporter [Lachnospiraceae bacterium]